jgi:phosphoribosyl-AMP cyclohydrolase/phosphoribosyl-ATP pyrophosphohydrolase/phosphoribosyl-AMP cyclohydrolase
MELSTLFEKSELIPVVIQDEDTMDVLMLGYANLEALKKTIETKTAWFWSRSRKKLWNKGETSGHFLFVSRIIADCDNDTLLYLCRPKGPTCHTGSKSCFFNTVWEESK